MKTKHWIIIAVIVVVALIAGYFLFFKNNAGTTIASPVLSPEAKAWEKEVQRNMAWMKNDPATVKLLQEKVAAAKDGRTYAQQLRMDAEWYAEKNGFIKPE